MKVAQVITRLNIGGPAIHAILLTHALAEPDFSSRLLSGFTAPTEGDMHELAKVKGVSPIMVKGLGREPAPARDLVVLFRLYRLLSGLGPDLVNTHMAKAGTVGRLAARLAGVPRVVHTYHGHVFHSYFGPAKTQLFLSIERFLSRLTDLIITVGDKQRMEILGYGVGTPDKVVSVPPGLELKQFLSAERHRGELRSELGIGPDVPLIGIVGRLVPVKGHADFLEAARLVSSRVPGVRFLVVGDGELREELERRALALGIGREVLFLGWRYDLARIYADLDLVVLSSHNEGSPFALIEAMAAGRAVIATNVGGVSDVVSDGVNGVLVPPRDPGALADVIGSLLRSGELITYGMEGRRSVASKYSLERLVTDMKSAYKGLAMTSCPK